MKLFSLFVKNAGDLFLGEATQPKPKPTATKTDWDSLFQDYLGPKHKDLPTVATPPPTTDRPGASGPKPKPTIRTASADTTRQRTAGLVTPEMASKLANVDMGAPDEISDTQARVNAGLDTTNQVVVRTTPDNLPKVMTNAMATTTDIIPDWHMVKNLPGYLASGIRAMGRAVFAPFTKTPIEQIQVLANLNNGGQPNSQREINAVANFLKQQGDRNAEAEIKFHEKIPDYDAQVQVYMAMGYTFVLVKDFAGNYIYSWPTADGDGLNIGNDALPSPARGRGDFPALPGPTRRVR